MNAKPISERTHSGCGPRGIGIIGLLILIGGLIGTWFALIQPLLKHSAAQAWPQTACKIVSSTVKVSRDSDGTTYRPEIKYQYTVAGKPYESERVSFLKFTGSSNRRSADETVRRYRAGAMTNCFYNPDQPDESTLEREFTHWIWLMLFPAVFVLVGGGMLWGAIKSGRSPASKDDEQTNQFANRPSLKPLVPHEQSSGISEFSPIRYSNSGGRAKADATDLEWDVPQKLKPTTSRLAAMLGIGFMAVFWNSITWFMTYQVVGDGLNGGFRGVAGIFSLLFMTPFLLIGLLMIVAFFHQFMAMFNPIVEIALSTAAVPLGGEMDLAWEISKGSQRLQRLKIFVTGTESATYRQGTDTRTDTQAFLQLSVLDTSDPKEMEFGSAVVIIPADTMHTFEAQNNRIQWEIEIKGEIAWWPDINEKFPFRVKPVS